MSSAERKKNEETGYQYIGTRISTLSQFWRKKIPPTVPFGTQTHNLSITSPALHQQAIPAVRIFKVLKGNTYLCVKLIKPAQNTALERINSVLSSCLQSTVVLLLPTSMPTSEMYVPCCVLQHSVSQPPEAPSSPSKDVVGGSSVAQLVECGVQHTAESGSNPRCSMGFFSQSQLSERTLLVCSYSTHVKLHAQP